MRFRTIGIGFIILGCVFVTCSKHKDNREQKRISVVVSILPEKYFCEKIGGDHIEVSVMVPPGSSPHAYEPKPSQIAALSRAEVYFTIGVEFEKVWMPRFVSIAKNMAVIALDSGIEKISMEHVLQTDHAKASEGEEEHGHDGLDPHIWLAPEAVKKMAERIAAVFCMVDSVNRDEYLRNKVRFCEEISLLQKNIRTILEENHITSFMVFHPSWGYFAHEFGLTQIPIEIEGKEPAPKDLVLMIDFARRNGIKTLFVQPQFSQKAAKTIASQIGGTVLPIDPLACAWEENLRQVAHALAGK
jgi:zinc transport system substrate-binding protein